MCLTRVIKKGKRLKTWRPRWKVFSRGSTLGGYGVRTYPRFMWKHYRGETKVPMDTPLTAEAVYIRSNSGTEYLTGFHTYVKKPTKTGAALVVCRVWIKGRVTVGMQADSKTEVAEHMIVRSRDWEEARQR